MWTGWRSGLSPGYRVANAALRFQPDVALLQQLGVAIPGPTSGVTTKWLWMLRDDRVSPVRVEIGISDGTLTEVARGDIHDGDLLVTDTAPGEQRDDSQRRHHDPRASSVSHHASIRRGSDNFTASTPGCGQPRVDAGVVTS